MAEKESRKKRLGEEGIGKPINFAPLLGQRKRFDKLMLKRDRSPAYLMREALEMYLVSQGFPPGTEDVEVQTEAQAK
jgi:hypothetical protein